jgi:predicted nucleotide-binding protein (sugar kinase/HSP70/actin superfamily)
MKMPLCVECYIFPSSVEVISKKIDKVEDICSFTLPMLETNQQYSELVKEIQKKYGNSLANNENIVTKFLNEKNQMVTFDSDESMEIAVQCQMVISDKRDPNTIGFVFKVYTGRTADQHSDVNLQGLFDFHLVLFISNWQ